MGNYRTGFSGHDLNRQFASPDYRLLPTIAAVKQILGKIGKDGKLLACLDLHAHSRKKCVFIYGPYYPLHSDKYYTVRLLPKLISDQSPPFRFPACHFRCEASKLQSARLVIWKELHLANSFTVECSLYGYLTEDRKTVPFNEQSVMDVGKSIMLGLNQYVKLMEMDEKSKEMKWKMRRLRRVKGKSGAEVSPIEAVVNSIKATDEDSDSSESADDTDQLDLEDQSKLHGEIVTVMQEFSELARPKPPRPATRAARIPAKPSTGRLTPQQHTDRIRDRSLYSSGFRSAQRRQIHAQPRPNIVIALPRMAEYRASRSVSAYRLKRPGPEPPSKLNIHQYALETRRLIAKLKGEEKSYRQELEVTPRKRGLELQNSEESVETMSGLVSTRSQMTRLTPSRARTGDLNPSDFMTYTPIRHFPSKQSFHCCNP